MLTIDNLIIDDLFSVSSSDNKEQAITIALGVTAAVVATVSLAAISTLAYRKIAALRRPDIFNRRVHPSREEDIESIDEDELFADFYDHAPPPRSTTLILIEVDDSHC